MKTKKVKPPKYPTFYMWEQTGAIAIWYPNNECEYIDDRGVWIKGSSWFSSGLKTTDIKICEIKD